MGGVRERVTWMLSKGVATRNELANALKLDKQVMRRHLNAMITESKTAKIERLGVITGSDGVADIGYRLISITSAKAKSGKRFEFNKTSEDEAEKKRKEAAGRARKRARLIQLGIYSDDMEALL